MGPVLFTVLHLAIIWSIGYLAWMQGYNLGKEGIAKSFHKDHYYQLWWLMLKPLGPIVIGALSP